MSTPASFVKLQSAVRNIKLLILVIIGVALISAIVLFLVGRFKPKGAGIAIETIPVASVFIDGVLAGRTPYEEVREPGEVIIKLVPDSFDKPLVPYEAKAILVSGVKTVIKWEFGETSGKSGGETVSFERVGRDETGLSVVTIPSSAQVVIDGNRRGFAPYKTSSVATGEHTLLISSEDYIDRTIRLKTYNGYKLTAIIQLIPSEETPEEVPEETPEEEDEVVDEVEILSTPTGFLRVRSEPSTLGEELARVSPGERYELLDEDEDTGWFKIKYEEGKEGLPAQAGWVSNTYAEKVEEEEKESLTPTVTPKTTPSQTTPTPSI